jgi:hypothetical protein
MNSINAVSVPLERPIKNLYTVVYPVNHGHVRYYFFTGTKPTTCHHT